LSKNIEQKQALKFSAKPIAFERMGDNLIRVSCYLLGLGINNNGSNLTKDAVIKANRNGLKHLPVVAHIIQDDDGTYFVGSHDYVIEYSPKLEVKPLTIPVGCIAGDSSFEFVKLVEGNGIPREYLRVDMILWSHLTPIMEAACNEDVYFNHSIEIEIIEAEWDETNNLRIDEFVYDRACLLGLDEDTYSHKHSEPAFELAQVYPKKYSKDNNGFNEMFSLLLNEIKVFQDDSINPDGNNPKDFNKEGDDTNMELTIELIEKVKSVLFETQFRSNSGHHYSKFAALMVTDTEVAFIDREDEYKAYAAPYFVAEADGEIIVSIDFEKKVEKSLIVGYKTDCEIDFSISDEVNTISQNMATYSVEIYESELVNKLREELTAKDVEFENLKATNTVQTEQLSLLAREKADLQSKNHMDAIDTIVNTYASIIANCGDFDEYRARLDYSKSVEEVEKDLKLIYATYSLAKDKRTAKFSQSHSGIVENANLQIDPMRVRYGNAFDNY